MRPRVHVDLSALTWNYNFLRAKAGAAKVGAAIKANAYGLGAEKVALALHRAGCRTFFTAYGNEALALRPLLPDSTLIALHGIDVNDREEAIARDIIPVLNDLASVQEWGALARKRGKVLPVCIHLDTGMNRLGLSVEEQEKLISAPDALQGLSLHAWISHLSCADDFQNPKTPRQHKAFLALLNRLPKAPASLANSSGLFWGDAYLFDLVRPGIALYGGNPTPHLPNPMRPVVALTAPILQVRGAAAGTTVGYGATRTLTRDSRIATIALGYADGYHRALSDKGQAMIGAFLAPILGRVSMDLITLDVTDVPESTAHVGAQATLIGRHRDIDTVAAEAGTIAYEIITSIGPRVLRDYGQQDNG